MSITADRKHVQVQAKKRIPTVTGEFRCVCEDREKWSEDGLKWFARLKIDVRISRDRKRKIIKKLQCKIDKWAKI